VLDPVLARRLKDAGLPWEPTPGDAFAIPDRDLDGQVFWVSDLVVELRQPPSGEPVLAFNGTTEWALDSLEAREAVWLPREDQLRDVLGPAFAALERQDGELEGWVVVTSDGARHADVTPAAAYARALLERGCY